YPPPMATVDDLQELQRGLKLDQVVIVQPSVYGTDNSCTLDAIRRLGGRARGVAVIDSKTPAGLLDEMGVNGIRGVRVNIETSLQSDLSVAKRKLDGVAEQIRGRNWHIQVYARTSVIAELKDYLAALPFTLVFDHFGLANAALGPNQAGFDTVLDLTKSGRAYVKLSAAYRVSEKAPDYADAKGLAETLVATNPDRLVW